MRTIKVLLLDDERAFAIPVLDLRAEGVELVVITAENDRYVHSKYLDASPKLCEEVAQMTKGKEIDLVIIGNNMDTGVSKARAIDEAMRDKVIVAWNQRRPSDEKPYVDLGFKHFCDRRHIVAKVLEVLAS